MFRRLVIAVLVLAVAGLAVFWILTTPRTLAASDLPDHTPDLVNGEAMFWAGGCASCHADPDARDDDLFLLGGGEPLPSPFGTFHAPNISPDSEDGIGTWTVVQFVNAMKFGVGDGGEHLYPAFPYTSYQRMPLEHLIDLKAFLDTLPAVEGQAPPHELPFPFGIRRGLGMWKLLYLDGATFEPDPGKDELFNRGAYLIGGPGHCGECHSPRNLIGGVDTARLYGGGPSPDGKGTIPNITTHEDALGWWTEDDIVTMFRTGQTASFTGLSGTMAKVQRNMANLDPSDWQAMAAYMKSIPPVAPPPKPEG